MNSLKYCIETPTMVYKVQPKLFEKFKMAHRGSVLATVVGIALAVIFIAFLIPVALNQFYAVDTTNWTDASVVSMWGLIPLFVIIGIVVTVIGYAIKEYVL